jgi:hypothetical protein
MAADKVDRHEHNVALAASSGGGSEGMAWPDRMINFAELDAQNYAA